MWLEEELWALAGEQRGAVADWQVRELGASRTELSRLRRSKHWAMVTSRVLRPSSVPMSDALLASAAVLDAGRGAVLSHTAAAAWWGIAGYDLRELHVSQPRPRANMVSSLAVMHDLRDLPCEWTTCLDSVAVVRPELMIYQLCGQVAAQQAERALDAAWSARLLTGRSLRAVLDQLAQSGRNGTTTLRSLLEARGLDYVPPATGLEGRFESIAAAQGVRSLRRQIDSGGDHWTGRVDFRDALVPLVVEIQSERYHAALSDKADDARRFEDLERSGFVVLEVWDSAVWLRRREVVRILLHARRVAAQPLPFERTHFCVR
jgi:very-short-patch-repair endonuclease